MRRRGLLRLVAAALAVFSSSTSCFAASSIVADHVALTILLETAAAPGKTVWAAITQVIAPGWHTYWRNPGDSGLATSISWMLPNGVSAGEPLWPVPEQFTTGSIINFGYKDQATILVPLTMAGKSSIGAKRPQATIFLLECGQMCIPETVTLDFDLRQPSGSPAIFASARAALPRTFDGDVRITRDSNTLTITLTKTSFLGADPSASHFYPVTPGVVDYRASPRIHSSGDILVWQTNLAARSKPFREFEGVLDVPHIGRFQISGAPR